MLFILTSSDLPQNCICDIKPSTLRFVTPHFSQIRYFFFCLRAEANTLFNNFTSFSKSCTHKFVFYIKLLLLVQRSAKVIKCIITNGSLSFCQAILLCLCKLCKDHPFVGTSCSHLAQVTNCICK